MFAVKKLLVPYIPAWEGVGIKSRIDVHSTVWLSSGSGTSSLTVPYGQKARMMEERPRTFPRQQLPRIRFQK